MYKSSGAVKRFPSPISLRKCFHFLMLKKIKIDTLIPVCPWATPLKCLTPAPPDFFLFKCYARWPTGRNPILCVSQGKKDQGTPPQVTGFSAVPPQHELGWRVGTHQETRAAQRPQHQAVSLQSATQIWKGSLISGLHVFCPTGNLSWGSKLHRLTKKQRPGKYGKTSMILRKTTDLLDCHTAVAAQE